MIKSWSSQVVYIISGASTNPDHALTRKYLENMSRDNIMLMLFTANRGSRSVAAWANFWGHSETDRGDECQSSRYWQVQDHHRWDSAGCYGVQEGCWWDCAWEPQARPAGRQRCPNTNLGRPALQGSVLPWQGQLHNIVAMFMCCNFNTKNISETQIFWFVLIKS